MMHCFQRSVCRFIRTRRICVSGMPLLAVALVGGCQEQSVSVPPPDNSQVMVIPGLGISNRYEVGMTFSQIKNSFPDAIARRSAWGKYSKSMLVPSLGAASFLGEDKPVSHINFHIDPFKVEMYPDLEIRTPFRGRLGNEFNFGEKSVSGQDVEAVYGPVLKRVLVAGDGLKLLQQGDPFSRSNRVNEETWYYPARGLAFDIKSNHVTSFQVFRPTATNASDRIQGRNEPR